MQLVLTLLVGEILALGIRPFARIGFEFHLCHVLDAEAIHVHRSELILIPRRAQINIKSVRIVTAQLEDGRRRRLLALLESRDALDAAQMIVGEAAIVVKYLRIQHTDSQTRPMAIRLDGVELLVALQALLFAVPAERGRRLRLRLAHDARRAIDVGVLQADMRLLRPMRLI